MQNGSGTSVEREVSANEGNITQEIKLGGGILLDISNPKILFISALDIFFTSFFLVQ